MPPKTSDDAVGNVYIIGAGADKTPPVIDKLAPTLTPPIKVG